MAREMITLSSFSSQLDILVAEGRYMEMTNAILSMMIQNVDLSLLAGKIIKFLAIPYPPCKKVMYAFLTRYSAGIADLNILATNSLLKDFQDPNPFIRRLVIRTMCSIPCLFDLAFQLLPQALCDSTAYVRCAAASACALVINQVNVKDNQDIINKLYEMIRDPDSSVICCSLSALNEILRSDGGVVINSKITHYLIKRISDFQGWNFTVIYMVLKKYIPKNIEELLFFLNALDEKILDSDPAVFPLAADLALFYINCMDKGFANDIIVQITPQLKLLLNSSSTEALAAILVILETYLPNLSQLLLPFYNLLFCRFSDSTFVKIKKLKILVYLINSSNVMDIAEELLAHCCDSSKEVSSQAIHSFTMVMKKYPQLNSSIRIFVSLMDIQYNNLSDEILNALSSIDLSHSADIRDCVLSAITTHSRNVKSIESKLSLLKFLGSYGKDIQDSPYIIEHFVNDEQNMGNEKLISFLLTTAMKLFLVRPTEMQLLLGRLLQCATKSQCLMLQKQASTYYYLLKDLKIAKNVIQTDSN